MNRRRIGLTVGVRMLPAALAVVAAVAAVAGCSGAAPPPQAPAAQATTSGASAGAAPGAQAAPAVPVSGEVKPASAGPHAAEVRGAGELIDHLSAGDIAAVRASFDDTMRAAISGDQIRDVWSQTVAQVGALKGRTLRSTQEKGAYTVVLMDCEHERGHSGVLVSYDGAGRVVGLLIKPLQ
jgi:hypothetical protein